MFQSSLWLLPLIGAPILLTTLVAYRLSVEERADFVRRSTVRRASARLLEKAERQRGF